MLTDDLAAIFADTSLSVSVTFGSPVQTTTGYLHSEDMPEPDTAGGFIVVRRRVVTLRDGALTGLASNLRITVDGVVSTIHGRPREAGRGKIQLVLA